MNANISTLPKYNTICDTMAKNKNTNTPQINPLTQLVDIAALNALGGLASTSSLEIHQS